MTWRTPPTPTPPWPVSCTGETPFSFLVQDGWRLLSPQQNSYKSPRPSYRHSGQELKGCLF